MILLYLILALIAVLVVRALLCRGRKLTEVKRAEGGEAYARRLQ